MIRKLCVFPNDPLIAYYEKGEIKERYFNPKNLFDEIHVISFCDNDIEVDKIQMVAGNANLKIHSVGKTNYLNKNKKKEQVLKLLEKISPNVIRAYNPRIEGWIACYCSQKLKIPFFVSLHVQYDEFRKMIKKKNIKKYLALEYSRKNIEPYVLKNAEKITAVYKIIDPYVVDLCGKHPEILYNRIDLRRFRKGEKITTFDKPLILSVSRLTPQKNHDYLIRAMKDIDAYLMIIGNGELKSQLTELVKELGLEKKVIFKNSVQNNEIQNYYKSADIFALAYDPKVEGVPMPVLEALAVGLPIIISKPIQGLSDGLDGSVIFAEHNSESFQEQLKKILDDKDFREDLKKKALEKSNEFDGEKIENREYEIYLELINSQQ